MRKRKLVKTEMNKSTASSLGSASDKYEQAVPLGADYDETPRVPFFDITSLSASVIHRAGVSFERDVYIGKYIAQRKPDHNI